MAKRCSAKKALFPGVCHNHHELSRRWPRGAANICLKVKELRAHCEMNCGTKVLLKVAIAQFNLSGRGHDQLVLWQHRRVLAATSIAWRKTTLPHVFGAACFADSRPLEVDKALLGIGMNQAHAERIADIQASFGSHHAAFHCGRLRAHINPLG